MLKWGSLAVGVALAALVPLHGAPQERDQPIVDPIPQGPIASGLGLTVQEFASFPKSAPVPAPTDPRLIRWARINYLGEIPDGSGRMFVPDINGAMYVIESGQPHVYLDVARTFAPGFFSGRGLGQGFAFVAFHPDFESNGKFYTVHTEAGNALTAKTPDLTPQPNHLSRHRDRVDGERAFSGNLSGQSSGSASAWILRSGPWHPAGRLQPDRPPRRQGLRAALHRRR